MKPLILKVSVLLIVLAFSFTSFAMVVQHTNNAVANTNSQTSFSPLIQQNSTSAGYAEFTLNLYNNTLTSGNIFKNSVNALLPRSFAYDSVNKEIYVSDNGERNIIIINSSNNEIIRSVSVGLNISQLIYVKKYDLLFGIGSNAIVGINPNTGMVLEKINVSGLNMMIYDPTNNYIYVSNYTYITVIDIANSLVLNTIKLPKANNYSMNVLVYDSNNKDIYVGNGLTNSILVVDTENNSIVAHIVAPNYFGGREGMIYDPFDNLIYFVGGSNCLYYINATSQKVMGKIQVVPQNEISGLCDLSYNASSLFVSNVVRCNIGIINVTRNMLVSNITIKWGVPKGLLYDSYNNKIYVAVGSLHTLYGTFCGLNGIAVINTTNNSSSQFISSADPPFNGIFFDKFNNLLYITDSSGTVSVINTSVNKLVYTIPVGIGLDLSTLTASNSTENLYLSGSLQHLEGGRIYVINTSTKSITASFANGLTYPSAMVYLPTLNRLYVAETETSSIAVINLSNYSYAGNISVGAYPNSMYYKGTGDILYALEGNSFTMGNLSFINTTNNRVIANLTPFNNSAEDFAFNQKNGCIYVASDGTSLIYDNNSYLNTLSIINSSSMKVKKNIILSFAPGKILCDPTNGYVYLAHLDSDIISVFDTKSDQVIGNITVGGIPSQMLYDPVNRHIYVANSDSNTLTIISTQGGYNLSFVENGLPSGTSWSVNLGGTLQSSTTSTIAFSEPNGTYSYTVASVTGYTSSPSSGSIKVKGVNANQAITFTPTTTSVSKYTVTFTESGLTSGTVWYVNITNSSGSVISSGAITSSSYSFSLTNGTYSFSVSSVSGYSTSPSSGTITVTGSIVSKTITFTPIKKPSPASGISNIELYGIIGAVVAVAVIGSVLAIMRKRR